MAEQESPLEPPLVQRKCSDEIPHIAIEIVSEEEMALIDAALFAVRPKFFTAFSSRTGGFSRAVGSLNILSKCRSKDLSEASPVVDIEDCSGSVAMKQIRAKNSLLQRFRRRRGLSVSDFTGAEWCEKQMEFSLLRGKPKKTEAMKAGTARHEKLEEEVIRKVKVDIKLIEDMWALRLINFIVGVNQLLFEGLTRELPLIVFVDDVWIVGVIDEIRMPTTEMRKNPILVDTKTRTRACLPTEAQRRNGRLQLMCYKFLWDTLVTGNFPCSEFFDFFGLNPNYIITDELKASVETRGLRVHTLEDLVGYCRTTSCVLCPANDELLLRYELQEDHSLIGEYWFLYESQWLKQQLRSCLEFWRGDRDARYVPEEERWKCRFCKFSYDCPASTESSISDRTLQ